MTQTNNTKRSNLEKFYDLMSPLDKAATVGDWNKVIYYSVALKNAASAFKARRAAHRARTAS